MKNKRICHIVLLLFLVAGIIPVLRAQQFNIDPNDPAFIKKYASFDFKGKFAVKTECDDRNNYYLLDFSLLPGRFEKVYFLNLSFKTTEIINLDANISRDKIWFLSDKRNPEKQVIELFLDLKKRSLEAATSYSDQQKAQWLKDNDKYK